MIFLCLIFFLFPLKVKQKVSRYVETCIFFLMILHWFLLACVPITSNEQKTVFGGQWTHYPIFFIQSIYTIEIIGKIISYGLVLPPSHTSSSPWGFVKTKFLPEQEINPNENTKVEFIRHHRAYLNSFGNILDTISVVSYWVDFVFMINGYPYISLFKSLGALRPIHLLSVLPGTAVILKSLETSWDILLAVSGLIFFFLLLFALFGLISFQGIFSRRCYYTASDSTCKYIVTHLAIFCLKFALLFLLVQLVEPAQFCSGYMNGTTVTGAFNTLTGETGYAGHRGFICTSGQICMEDPVNNPQSGFVNYDNIFFSLLSVYTFVSLELWTDLMYQTQDADSTVAALYYCLGVYIISFVLTFLLFGKIHFSNDYVLY